MIQKQFRTSTDLVLESGKCLEGFELTYCTYGNPGKPVVWVCHALTANANVMEWWRGLFGEDCLFNPEEYFIICSNIIGSPYGSTRPLDLTFPEWTIRDCVAAQLHLANSLNISEIAIIIGGSCGGSQVLEFALQYQGTIGCMITIASAPKESPWCIAIHEAQRMALQASPGFGTMTLNDPGVSTARAIGMLSYRTQVSINEQQEEKEAKKSTFKAASYIQYQGKKFAKRFDNLAYYYLSKWLDTHDIGRDRGGYRAALASIEIPALVIAIDSDQLISTPQQQEMAELLPLSTYYEISSYYGHDGFLIEVDQLNDAISQFLKAIQH